MALYCKKCNHRTVSCNSSSYSFTCRDHIRVSSGEKRNSRDCFFCVTLSCHFLLECHFFREALFPARILGQWDMRTRFENCLESCFNGSACAKGDNTGRPTKFAVLLATVAAPVATVAATVATLAAAYTRTKQLQPNKQQLQHQCNTAIEMCPTAAENERYIHAGPKPPPQQCWQLLH